MVNAADMVPPAIAGVVVVVLWVVARLAGRFTFPRRVARPARPGWVPADPTDRTALNVAVRRELARLADTGTIAVPLREMSRTDLYRIVENLVYTADPLMSRREIDQLVREVIDDVLPRPAG